MPQTTRFGFILREPPRSQALAGVAAVGGKALQFLPHEQRPSDREIGGAGPVGPTVGHSFGVQKPVDLTGKPLFGFKSPKVKKGWLVDLETQALHQFMFNPTEIARQDGWEWASHKIPGASHPVLSGGSGASRTISFTLYFDADRGRSHERDRTAGPGAKSGDNPTTDAGDKRSLDLTEELNYYRSFTYPVIPPSGSLRGRGPARLSLTFGRFFSRLPCVMRQCNVTVHAWTPKLEPLRASVAITLEEIMRNGSISSSQLIEETPDAFVNMNSVVGSEVDR